MNIKKLIKEEFNKFNRNNKRKFIKEDYQSFNNKTIINVDIQPEYESGISFDIEEWLEFLNNNHDNNQIIFLYNGADTLGMISENDYIQWLIENGADEDLIDDSLFYDKGYAFFRYCIDNSIDDDTIVDFIKYMVENNINDSRDIDKEMWNDFMNKTNNDYEDIRELLEDSDDMINIPDLMDFISNYNNIILTGGGLDECLKEVELSLMSLDKNYQIYNQFTY